MRKPTESVLVAVAVLGILPPPVAVGDALAVTLDGRFRDGSGVAAAATDPAGDGRDGSVDLRRLWLANGAEALYLLFDPLLRRAQPVARARISRNNGGNNEATMELGHISANWNDLNRAGSAGSSRPGDEVP